MTTPTQGEHAQTEALRQILLDPENQPNQYGAQFLMHGPKMAFKIGARQFTLDYEPTEPGEFEFMRDALIDAFSVFTPDVKTAQPAAPQGVAYAELDDAFESWLEDQDVDRLSDGYESWLNSVRSCWDSALRASHRHAPAGVALEELLILLGSKKAWPSYYFNHKDRYECCDCGEEHDDYAEITHAETCDFTQATADRKRIKELVEILKSSTPTAQAAPAAGAVAGPNDLITIRKPTTRQEVEWLAKLAHLLLGDVNKTLDDLLAAAPTSAAQADSKPALTPEAASAMVEGMDMNDRVLAAIDAETRADSVLEDAARWRRLVNASEMAFPVAAIVDDPENDATNVYGRKRMEALIDMMDEIPGTYVDAARKQGGA